MFQGSMIAIVTPFTKTGKIDEEALEKIVAWQVEKGADGIVCCGTTGEAPTLSDKEKERVLSICIKAANKRAKVIMGTGCNDTKKSVKLTKKAKKLGADGCLVVVPYYNRPTQDGCVEHFRKIANVGLPVIVYHHPGRTGVTLQPQTFARLEKIPNIVAVKEASNNLQTVEEIQKVCSLPILSGDDGLTVEIMQRGGVGVISVVANVLPFEWKQLVDLCQKKSFDEAKKLQEQFQGILQSMFLETNPQCVKFALHCMGRCSSKMRLPLLEPAVGAREKILSALKESKVL